ncbi:hypothetical protein ACMSE0_07980 [Bacteroides thetaiotaomicron]|uniref:hypothetical protein n=1 Tax=Bacteroides hominis TaxID=2763023 RepID=UPI00294A7CE3|nr:hypothetical protein [Bacteroides hominis (ex Liu et al. 2022)]MDV6203227.1 hypothetical protein [Bacteroides hominis (ex Liu et al. 2022)]
MQHDSDEGLKAHPFNRMFGQQSGHLSKRSEAGVNGQPDFHSRIHAYEPRLGRIGEQVNERTVKRACV